MCCRTRLFAVLFAMLCLKSLAGETHTVYWNKTNPSFTKDHSSWELNVRVNDVIKVVCPFVGGAGARIEDDYNEEDAANYLKIHSVDEMAYLNCVLDSSRREVSICDSPHEKRIVSIPIRKFAPHPNSFEFRPGRTYYWISTSSGSSSGIGFQHYGLCRDENMRLAITVSEAVVEEPPGDKSPHSGRAHRISPPATETTTPPAPAQDMKMVLGWIERGMQGTFTFAPDTQQNVGEAESASDAMTADELTADSREVEYLPDGRSDYIISEAITSSSTNGIAMRIVVTAVLLLR